MIAFGWAWVAMWAGPLSPAFLVLALLVAFYRWMWQLTKQGVALFNETMQKLQTQNQLMAYLTSEEIKMILEMAKRVDAESEKRMGSYKEVLRKERLEMIDDKWTQTCANYELTEEDEE